jgi:SHS family lactate transporter-like MFS transporter
MLGLGVFWLQVMVQGAWGVVPVHLNELSPDAVRATMPGLTYQIGNFISAGVPWVLTTLAEANHKQYGLTMAVFIAGIAIMLAVVTALGPEAKGQRFGAAAAQGA